MRYQWFILLFIVLVLVVMMNQRGVFTEGFELALSEKTIPHKVWQTYKTANLPKSAEDCQRTWIGLEHIEYHFEDDFAIDDFMKKNFDSKVYDIFRSFPLGVMRADMWRYCVLYIHGGVYSDIDSQALRPLSAWKIEPQDKLIVGLENDFHFCQWTIASVPKHPLFKAVIDRIVKETSKGIDISNEHFVHQYTGPGIWTRVIHEFLGFPIEQKARHTYNLYRKDPRPFRKLGIRLEDRPFFSSKMVKNFYGSTQFEDGYVSWIEERNRLRKST